jgi:hypothetical protein
MFAVSDVITNSTTNHHNHHNHHPTMSDPSASLTPTQIRRRAIDYDSQIREGLDEGNIRQVVKRLGVNLVSKKFFVD